MNHWGMRTAELGTRVVNDMLLEAKQPINTVKIRAKNAIASRYVGRALYIDADSDELFVVESVQDDGWLYCELVLSSKQRKEMKKKGEIETLYQKVYYQINPEYATFID